jgi:hypothetical protein
LAPYDEIVLKTKKSHYNVTFSTKVMILLNKFPHVERIKSQIIFHVKCTNSKISQVCNNPHVKITSSTQNRICNFKNIKQMHDIKDHINSKEDTCESKHVNTYRQKIQDVPITLCFCREKICFLKQLKIVTNKLT